MKSNWRFDMKKIFLAGLIGVLCVAFTVNQAVAGPKNKHLAESIIIGTSAAILGTVILHEIQGNDRHPPVHAVAYQSEGHHPGYDQDSPGRGRHYQQYSGYYGNYGPQVYPGQYQYRPLPNQHNGPCLFQKVWVAPQYTTRWVPGHYDRWRRWIPASRSNVLVRDGYWEKQKICRR